MILAAAGQSDTEVSHRPAGMEIMMGWRDRTWAEAVSASCCPDRCRRR
jgi:hypothetical protein